MTKLTLKLTEGSTPDTSGPHVVFYSRAGSREKNIGTGYFYADTKEWLVFGQRGVLGSPVTSERGKNRQRTPTVHAYAKV